MGCGASKVDDLPLVTLCRERKEFLKAASEQRYALAAAHVAYFQSLKEIGGALRKFVDEELVIGTGSSSPSSPVLTLPSDEGKGKKPKLNGKNRNSSSSTSISHTAYDNSPDQEEIEASHLNLSSGSDSDSDSDLDSSHGHIHIEDDSHIHIEESPERDEGGPSYTYPPPQDWSYSGVNTYAYYMKKSASAGKSIVYEEPERYVAISGQWPDPSYGYQGAYENAGVFGFPMGPPPGGDYPYNHQPGPSTPAPPPAPPSPPVVSSWDFLNVFDTYDNGYPGFYPQSRYGFGSTTSSPDSKEVREREGIPELEDETEQEVVKDVHKERKKLNEDRERVRNKDVGEGTSKAVPLESSSSEGSSKTVPFHSSDSSLSAHEKEIKSSPDSDRIVSNSSPPEEHVRKKGVSFEVDEAPVTAMDGESSKLSSVTTLSAHGTRDLREVVEEIKDEFETASSYGKEVALLLEIGKPPYLSRGAAFKVIFSRILYMVAPSKLPSHPPSRPSIRLSSRAMKLAKAYCEEPAIDFKTAPGNLSSTLEKLYAWEKKLYKEVKDEERLRVDYEKQCKRLKILDDRGAESSKIDATEASIRKLHTKINICIRTVDAISSRIHKLRDEELQPQLSELIQGLTRMWKFMLKCHQKQFQAIMESKTRSLKMNTALQRDAGLKATLELEMELLNWCTQFNNWVKTQKSYVENLNEWLMRCLLREREETADGVVPFSPSRIGAPQVFIICNDWYQAMTRISERGVADAMHEFAQKLHELWERQDEEQRQRIKAEYLTKDFEKRLRTLRMDTRGSEHEHEKVSDKTTLSKSPSESGVSPLDDLKVDLDSIRKRVHEERVRHKEAIKLVHDAASNSLIAGLVPIFKTLESFTSEVVTAHEQVRLENAENS